MSSEPGRAEFEAIRGNPGVFRALDRRPRGRLGMQKPSLINKGVAAAMWLQRALRSRSAPGCLDGSP
jgi:hypothetical protein